MADDNWSSYNTTYTDTADTNSTLWYVSFDDPIETEAILYKLELWNFSKNKMRHFQSALGRRGYFQYQRFPQKSIYFFKLKNHSTIFSN